MPHFAIDAFDKLNQEAARLGNPAGAGAKHG